MSKDGRVVVGVDGSPTSVEAIKWAAQQADRTSARLEAVIAWHYPTSYGFPVIADVDWADTAWATLDEAIEKALGDRAAAVVRRVIEGHPSHVLADAAVGADALVVGARGHGGFAGLLLGSVSTHMVGHALCPVVVVPRTCAEPAAAA